jgi:hypothetical protein
MILNHAPRLNFNRLFDRTVLRDRGADSAQHLTTFRPCNDNQRSLSTASFRRTRRPVLFCRWRKAPGGALECVWCKDVEAAGASEEPVICRLDESPRRSVTVDVAGKLHCAVNRTERLDSLRASFFNSNRSGASVCLIGKRESGATLTWSLVRSCPRNCQRRAIFSTRHWALPSKVWEGRKW